MEIKSNKAYKEAVHKVYSLMNKGDVHISEAEAAEIELLSKAIEYYEDHVLKIMPLPVTVATIVQDKIEELNITQVQLAAMFGIATSKLSQILSGKRKPDVSFLKAVHEKLGIDGNFILEKA
ncbi:helix-turn-helix domain-containing protein [Dinghuibacter silviterrae]|uniref:Antitoxin component HigA of HigAB toxin-antitoxin module n=1 Tax=Dinghuibacter silviterrae TaxID=1539049 RepID=A0A4R8DT63_9BACT|nr:helix-turn-helix domain-containing protein [Dinghuibacter silviterrae]TDX00341.1 antitoxin component HigA of HigAB toxin-antitoxin module [Dinghuibacter silviterrae]